MKSLLTIPLTLLLFILPHQVHAKDIQLTNTNAQVYFSPHGGCTDAIVKELDKAKSEILVQAYSFTSKEIAQALVNAKKRGIQIQIILDRSNRSGKYSAGDFTAHMGIPTYIDFQHAI